MAAVQRKLVHKQFNSPIGMYSDDNVKDTLNREIKALSNGAVGIDFSQPSSSVPIPANLKNSAVLRMLEEQEYEKTTAKANTRQSRARERVIIDRQTVLKINRRHKRRDYSWPPPSLLDGSRSRSSSNEIHFDDKVCKRHEIRHLREMFDKGVIFEKGRKYNSTMSCDRSTAKGSKNVRYTDGIHTYTDNKNSSKSYGVNYEQGNNVGKGGYIQYEWPPKSQFSDTPKCDDGGMGGLSNSLINKTYHLPKDQLHFEEIEKIREYFERESSQNRNDNNSGMKKWKSHDSLHRIKSPENMTPISNEPKCLQRYKSNSYNELLPPQKPKRQFAKNLSHTNSDGTTKMLNANELLKIDTNGDDIKTTATTTTTTATTSEISVETSTIIDSTIIREKPTTTTSTATTSTATVTSIIPTWNDVSIKKSSTQMIFGECSLSAISKKAAIKTDSITVNDSGNITAIISNQNVQQKDDDDDDGGDKMADNTKTNVILDTHSNVENRYIKYNDAMKNSCNFPPQPPGIQNHHQRKPPAPPAPLRKQPRGIFTQESGNPKAHLNDRRIKRDNGGRDFVTETQQGNIELSVLNNENGARGADRNYPQVGGMNDLKTNEEKYGNQIRDESCRPPTSATRNSDFSASPSVLATSRGVGVTYTDGEYIFGPYPILEVDDDNERINVSDSFMPAPIPFVRTTSKDIVRNFLLVDEYLKSCERAITEAEHHLTESPVTEAPGGEINPPRPSIILQTPPLPPLIDVEYTPIVEQVLFDLYNFSKVLDTFNVITTTSGWENALEYPKYERYKAARVIEIGNVDGEEGANSKHSSPCTTTESDTSTMVTATSRSESSPVVDRVILSRNILSGFLVSKKNQEEVLERALGLMERTQNHGHLVIDLADEGQDVCPRYVPEIRIISPGPCESTSSIERVRSTTEECETDGTIETSKSFDVYTFDHTPVTGYQPNHTPNDGIAANIATTTPSSTTNLVSNSEHEHLFQHPNTEANISTKDYNDISIQAMDNNSRNDNEINYDEKCIIEKAAEHALGNRRRLQQSDAIDSCSKDRIRSISQPSRSETATNIECVPWRRPRNVTRSHEEGIANEMPENQQQMYPLQKQHSFDSSDSRYFSSANLFLTGSFERTEGYKKVQWPPNDGHYVKGSTPQPSGCPSQQPQQESGDNYQQAQPNYPQRPPQSQGHSGSYPPKQQQYYQQQHPQQQAQPQQQYHPPQQQPHPYSQQQNRPYNQPQQQQQQFPRGPASSTVSFSGGVAVNKPAPSQPQSQYQPPYQQQQQQPQSPQYQQPQQQYHQPQHQYQAPEQNQQQHYQPPQQQQHYQPPQQQQHYQQHQPQSPSGATLSPSYQPTAPSYNTHPPRSSVSPKGWHHVNAAPSPTRFGFTQHQPQYQSGAPTSYGSERDLGSHQRQYESQAHHAYEQSVNQYQTSSHQQPIQYYQQHHQHSNKFETTSQEPPQTYGQQHQQHQQYQQHQQHNQGYVPTQQQNGRGQSPGIITLRKEAPITQQPAPVYASQPAALGYKDSSDFDLSESEGGCNMRGDLKWPPPEYKAQAAAENEERLRLAKQPATRPLLPKKDYSAFFAKHALNSTYPAYKAPPGTQHYAQYAHY